MEAGGTWEEEASSGTWASEYRIECHEMLWDGMGRERKKTNKKRCSEAFSCIMYRNTCGYLTPRCQMTPTI